MKPTVNITIRGPKGTGKTFIAEMLAKALLRSGVSVTCKDRSPGSPASKILKEHLGGKIHANIRTRNVE